MLRYITLLLAVVLLVGIFATADAYQTPVPTPRETPSQGMGLTGTYINQESGATCYVRPMGRGYLFVDEAVQRVPFVWAGSQLRSTSGNITVTVSRDDIGR